MTGVTQDWSANSGRPYIQGVLVLFRIAQKARTFNLFGRPLALVPTILYRCGALFVLSIDVPVSTAIGPGFQIHHGIGIVIHNRAKLGANVSVRQNVTIGAATTGGQPPIVGDNVDLGANCVLIGPIKVGDHSTIGAGAVVTKDVPEGAVMIGNPARVLRIARTSHEEVSEV